MSKLRVILVSGYKRSGKDFVSTKLNEMIEGSNIISFAEPMKDIISITMGVSKVDLEKFKNNRAEVCVVDTSTSEYFYHNNMREILQQFGSEAMKKYFGDDVWANLVISKLPEDGVVIISDWRFQSEYNALSKVADVTTIRVKDSNLTGDGHISEHDLDDFKFDVYMDNTDKDESIMYPINSFINVW